MTSLGNGLLLWERGAGAPRLLWGAGSSGLQVLVPLEQDAQHIPRPQSSLANSKTSKSKRVRRDAPG